MVKVPLVSWGTPWGFTANTTTYVPLSTCDLGAASQEDRRYIIYREAGTFSDLFVRVTANTTTANSTIRTRKNAATNGNLEVTIGSGATGIFEDTADTDTVTAGDKWAYQCVSGTTGTTLTVSILSCMFEATTNRATKFSVFAPSTTATTTTYFALTGVTSSGDATENNIKNRVTSSAGGSLKNMYVRVITNSKAGNTPVRIRKNGANGTVVVTVGSNATGEFEDTTHSDSFASGNDASIALETSVAGTISFALFAIGWEFTDDNGWLLNAANSAITFAEPLTRYFGVGGAIRGSIANEPETQLETRIPLTFFDLTVYVSANAITAVSTFRTRKNTANGNCTCSITSSGTGYFNDPTNQDDCDADDLINYQLVTPAVGGSPTMTIRSMGCIVQPLAAANNVVRAVPTETVSASEGIAIMRTKIRTRTETAITISENRARLAAKNRALSTQTTALSESVIRVKGKVKTLATETITITGGTLARLLAKIRTASDTTAIVENRARLAAKNRALSAQSITVTAGTLARIKGAIKAIPQTIAVGENLARLSNKIRALATQSITVGAGTAARLKASQRVLATQTVAIGENLVRIKGILRSIATQTVTVGAGSIARLSTKIRAVSTQTVAIVEDLQRTISAGAQNIVKTLSDTVVLSENIARLKAAQRLLSQDITIDSIASRLKSAQRILSQTVLIADFRARIKSAIRVLALQTIILTEARARIKGSVKTIPQSIIIGTGTIARLAAKIRAIPQTIIIAENNARISAKLRPLAIQTVSIGTGNIARIKGSIRTISQTITIGENIVRLSAKIRALAIQSTVIADNVARQIIGGPQEIIRALTQTVVLSETVGRRLAAQRILTQTIPMAENLARVRGVLRTLSQSIPVSESRSRIKSASRLLSQTLLSSDNLARLNALRRTVIQTTIIAENVAQETVGNLVRSLVETITISDSIIRRTAKLVILDQFVVIAEQASRISAKLRTIPSQTIILSDSATNEINVIIKHVLKTIAQATAITDHLKLEVVKKSQRFRKILDPSIKRLKSNHPAWFLGSRGMHDHYEEFSPG